MSPEHAGRAFLVAACICAGAVLLIGWMASRPLTLPAAGTTALRFDSASALRYTAELAERYPNRVTGSASSRRSAAFLASRFRALGNHVEMQPFEMWLHGKRIAGQNVIAFRGARGPYVAVVAHYDAATTTVQAAEDDASGVGTVLELARTRRDGSGRAIFAATDAEEWGMIGARHLGAYLRSQGRGSVISIDYLNAGNARTIAYTASGQFSGYTPLWLRQIARAAALREAGTVEYSYGMTEWIDRAVAQSFQDQGPLLQQGVPAINLMSVPSDINAARNRYHTPQDVFSGFAPRTFAIVGRTAERIEDALDDPRTPSEYDGFLLSPNRYLPLPAVYAMQFIALIPLLAAGIGAALQRPAGFMRFATLVLPPLAALLAARVFALTNVLPRYELDAATPKDPFLYHVPAAAGFAIIAIAAGGYAALLRNGVPVLPKKRACDVDGDRCCGGFFHQPVWNVAISRHFCVQRTVVCWRLAYRRACIQCCDALSLGGAVRSHPLLLQPRNLFGPAHSLVPDPASSVWGVVRTGRGRCCGVARVVDRVCAHRGQRVEQRAPRGAQTNTFSFLTGLPALFGSAIVGA